jgi:hypothetical protein
VQDFGSSHLNVDSEDWTGINIRRSGLDNFIYTTCLFSKIQAREMDGLAVAASLFGNTLPDPICSGFALCYPKFKMSAVE